MQESLRSFRVPVTTDGPGGTLSFALGVVMKSALIVDDHPVVCAAVRMVLENAKFTQIHEASSGSEVLSLIRQHHPQLVVLDLGLPGMDGLEVLARVKANGSPCRILIFTSLEPLFYQERCLRAGAMGYVAKTNHLHELDRAIKALMSGYSYFSALPGPRGLSAGQTSEKQAIDALSDRELNIFLQLSHGKANKQIAKDMNLSHKTISTYKTRMMIKLGLTSLVLLREFAKRNHLI